MQQYLRCSINYTTQVLLKSSGDILQLLCMMMCKYCVFCTHKTKSKHKKNCVFCYKRIFKYLLVLYGDAEQLSNKETVEFDTDLYF